VAAKKGAKRGAKKSSKRTATPRKPKTPTRRDLLVKCLKQMINDLLVDTVNDGITGCVVLESPFTIDGADHWLTKDRGERFPQPIVMGRQLSSKDIDRFLEEFVENNVVLDEIERLFEATSVEQ
jgi:hypothetical protein